jgi:hypothetical protein
MLFAFVRTKTVDSYTRTSNIGFPNTTNARSLNAL